MGGGITQSVLDRIKALEIKYESINQIAQNKLDLDKVVNTPTITQPGYAADARQLNPAEEGSLANQLLSIKNGLGSLLKIDTVWLNGTPTNLAVKHESNDRFNYSYNLGSVPTGYKFLFGVPFVSWFGSNIYVDIEFAEKILLSMSGKASLYIPNLDETSTTFDAVFSAYRIFLKSQ